jgi:hypothetical protein
MSPIPLPIDNLYKFMAICGLVVVVANEITSNQLYHRFFELKDQQLAEMYKASAARTEAGERLVQQFEAAYRRNDAAEIATLNRRFDEWKALPRDQSAEEKTVIAMQESLDIERDVHRKVTLLEDSVALLLSAAGFVLWYLRVQRYVDRQVKTTAGPLHTPVKKASRTPSS